ncbi:HTTM domain-containing protein [Candidatus Poriferisodalis sp.]|uniref:HTTM domain-containing protein n=1 Tax=Candidatus Poriferisodalis sp. TaxID=3101277 RepID=UPI003B525C42
MPTATALPDDTHLACRSPGSRRVQAITAAARRAVCADSVAVFRIAFGAIAALAALRFLANGWVEQLYVTPRAHLTYPGFGWVQPLSAPWLHVVVGLVGAAGVAMALGWRYRIACWVFLVSFTYLELIEATLYLNHYWFVTLCALVLAMLPAHHHWSLDARTGRVQSCALLPAVVVWALRAQVGVVYVFAGLAKLNADWLGHGLPLRLWLADRADTWLVGPLLGQEWVAVAASWGAAAFDCTIVGWLLWRRSRPWAYAVAVVFHFATGALFAIGVFPLVMAAAALIFFEPDWPLWLASRTHLLRGRVHGAAERENAMRTARPALSWPQTKLLRNPLLPEAPGPRPASHQADQCPRLNRVALAALAALAAVQLAMPLRHLAYPGDVRWTEEGYWGAWRVMLTDKAAHLEFEVTDPVTGHRWMVGPDLVLEDWQTERAGGHPDLIVATAHLIAEQYRRSGFGAVEVRADAWVSMNGRPAQRIIDPAVDLAAQPRTLAPAPWIMQPGDG